MNNSAALEIAQRQAGLPVRAASLLRDGENSVWRLEGGVVARISRSDDVDRIRRELQVADWLAAQQFPAVRPLRAAQHPVPVGEVVVTFWEDFGRHSRGTVHHVAELLRRLHALPAPRDFDPGFMDPFVRLESRTNGALILDRTDRDWLLRRIAELRKQWRTLPKFPELCLVHGDAWVGNVAQLASGETLLLDLERSSLGPPEWDLVSTAIKLTSFGWISPGEYQEFCDLYGFDVTDSERFELLRDLRELRMTTYALQRANHEHSLVSEASLRLRSLQGREGQRPWPWSPTS